VDREVAENNCVSSLTQFDGNTHFEPFCRDVGISPSTFWKYVGLGKIKIIPIGGRVLVPDAEANRVASEGIM
jgi:hypothetical protein